MFTIFSTQKNDFRLISFPVGDLASNTTIVFNEKNHTAIVFDPGFSSQEVMTFIKDHHLEIDKQIFTHGHFDHIASAPDIFEQQRAPIFLHKEDESLYLNMHNHASLFGLKIHCQPIPIHHFLEEGSICSFNEHSNAPSFTCIHTPGHSKGSCCFFTNFFDAPLLIAGDTLFQNSIGRTDLPGGNYDDIMISIKEKLLILPPNTNVITGHGQTTTILNEKKGNPYLI